MDDKWEIDSGNQLLPVLESADGGAVDITRNGEVIATVTPRPKRDVAKARKAMDDLLALSVDLKLEPGETIMDLINEGRKS
ncbi:MAG: hypothetical protein P0Y65_04040 [Candidatus Devosia phytovorans]|uniref:Uncharacterized protein n=1 Tax=Candidatus Devosia phytovorans TaxID=3121372 RepID=A0AAJ6B0P8_9HYPH|nr:hypothetical protein [Devosia sp.]WEK05437.1 MAG: hypothetical protein P0Y65_04040 [Devosia sp.]